MPELDASRPSNRPWGRKSGRMKGQGQRLSYLPVCPPPSEASARTARRTRHGPQPGWARSGQVSRGTASLKSVTNILKVSLKGSMRSPGSPLPVPATGCAGGGDPGDIKHFNDNFKEISDTFHRSYSTCGERYKTMLFCPTPFQCAAPLTLRSTLHGD